MPGEDPPLIVEPVAKETSGGPDHFDVRLKPGAPLKTQVYTLRAWTDRDPGHFIGVPVMIRVKG